MDMTRTDVRTPPGQGILTVLWPCSDAAQNTSAQADRSSGAGNILLFVVGGGPSPAACLCLYIATDAARSAKE